MQVNFKKKYFHLHFWHILALFGLKRGKISRRSQLRWFLLGPFLDFFWYFLALNKTKKWSNFSHFWHILALFGLKPAKIPRRNQLRWLLGNKYLKDLSLPFNREEIYKK